MPPLRKFFPSKTQRYHVFRLGLVHLHFLHEDFEGKKVFIWSQLYLEVINCYLWIGGVGNWKKFFTLKLKDIMYLG